MKKLYFLIVGLVGSLSGYSQTILDKPETTSRTVSDPQAVILANGFHAKADAVNPFVAKIGESSDHSGGGPTDSDAGSTNPFGQVGFGNFHDTQGSIEVNGGGQLQYTLPIALPPGVKSVAPQMNLVYTSGSGNGIAGYGWSLSGITSISRMGRTIDKDGEVKGVQLDYSDYYSFNGQRLILKSGEYGKDGAEYVTEKYSNVKIKSLGALNGFQWQGPVYFEVTFEDGSQAWYGSTPESRTPIEYNIVKWKDAQGNYITYNYTQDNNVALISTVLWGGNETINKAHINKISFNYALRQLKESSYVKGLSFLQNNLLSSVAVYTNDSPFKKYEIAYKKDINGTNYQFVDKITEYNSKGHAANPVVFEYEKLPSSSDSYRFRTYLSDNNNRKYADFNLDGVTDYLEYTNDGNLVYQKSIYRSDNEVKLSYDRNWFTAEEFRRGTILSFKNNNYAYNNPAIIIPTKRIGAAADKYDYIFSIYSINITSGKLNFEYSKTIPYEKYHILDSIDDYPEPNCNASETYIGAIESHDFNGDGISEVLINFSRHIWCRDIDIYDVYPPSVIDFQGDYSPRDYYTSYVFDLDQNKTIDNSLYRYGLTSSNTKYYGDYNGDGLTDVMEINNNGNISSIYNFKYDQINGWQIKQIESFSGQQLSSLYKRGLFGDYNGDGKTDILIPQSNRSSNWDLYLSNGTVFEKFYINNFITFYAETDILWQDTHNTFLESGCSYSGIRYYQYSIGDLDNDGKSDIIVTAVKISSHLWEAHANDEYTDLNIDIYSLHSTLSTTVGGFRYTRHTQTDSNLNYYCTKSFSKYYPKQVIPFSLLTLNRNNNQVIAIGKPNRDNNGFRNMAPGHQIEFVSFSHLPTISRLTSITQGGLKTEVEYKELDPVVNPGFYAAVKKEQYPYMEMDKVSQSYAVAQLRQYTNFYIPRKQDFRYRGFIANLHGKGMIGFRKTARSSWYADGFENTKIWSGAEIDPLNNAVPKYEWSIKTNDEGKIFPTNISFGNTELISLKQTEYQTEYLLNNAVVTSYSDADKHRLVTALVPVKTTQKDFIKDITTVSQVQYGSYYLPSKTTTTINGGFAVSSTDLSYLHNPSGEGKDYFIGRPETKIESLSAYGDTKGAKEEYTYENNLLKTKKSYDRIGDDWVMDTYTYDGFGNIIQKIITNKTGDAPQIAKTEYDALGRFVNKKTDNLGLETTITYNDWGQVRTQTDPLGNTLTNIYDDWGKLLTSKTNLGGTTTYTYQKDATNGDAIVTEYAPTGNIKHSYTNRIGQQYKTLTKGFSPGSYIAQITVYDILGRKIAESEPYEDGSSPVWNTIAYDDSVFPAKVTATAFNGKKMETSISGRTTFVKELNGYGRTTSKTTDAVGNVVTSTDKGGSINFSFNAAGENTAANYAGNIVTTKYDHWGRKIEFHDPSNGLYKFEYQGYFGAISKEISPKGYKSYAYNDKGQLKNVLEKSNDGVATDKSISFTYNAKGMLTLKNGYANGRAYSSYVNYDAFGRVLSSGENSNGKHFVKKAVTYDNTGRVISYEKGLYSSGIYTKTIIENVYSPWSGDLLQVKEKTSGKTLWELQETNAKGQVKRARLGAAEVNNTYDANNFLSNVSHVNTGNGATLLQLGYSFNAIKNELNSRTRGGDLNIIETFTYDDNNRLVNWTNPKTGNMSFNTYDEKGRITENDQVGHIKFENTQSVYRPSGTELNVAGEQNYLNNLIQKISYNENNDPIFIDGEKGDVRFTYGLTEMRQMATYGGNFNENTDGAFTKYYSEDGSYEIIRNNQTGQEKHILYIGGSPYESEIVYLKDFTEAQAKFVFLHKDYLGSILAISDEAGNAVEQRHFDAWGNFTHLKVGNGAIITDHLSIINHQLLIDRGYTSHEHFSEVGIIHMNGRLYDPLLRRFLNADENIQDPHNTQNYNKYGYVMNNPLMYNDPNGEWFIFSFLAVLTGQWWALPITLAMDNALLIGAAIGAGMYLGQAAFTGNFSWRGFTKSIFMGAVTGAVSGALGQVFSSAGFWASVGNGALAGAGSGGITSIINGENFFEGLLKGAVIGGAIGAVSYAVKYYTSGANKAKYTKSDGNSYNYKYDPTISNDEMQQNVMKMRYKNFSSSEIKEYGVGKDIVGPSTFDGHLSVGGEKGVLGYTAPMNFMTGKSDIYYAPLAAQNNQLLAKVMVHETAHAYTNKAMMIFSKIPTTESKGGYRINFDERLGHTEHIAIYKLEHLYAKVNNINNISHITYQRCSYG
ncbi:MAG: hypothetical protein KBA33_07815 [Cloacibacterium sp.]|nr:hypothetical protein [Cloacibacterium sp.]